MFNFLQVPDASSLKNLDSKSDPEISGGLDKYSSLIKFVANENIFLGAFGIAGLGQVPGLLSTIWHAGVINKLLKLMSFAAFIGYTYHTYLTLRTFNQEGLMDVMLDERRKKRRKRRRAKRRV